MKTGEVKRITNKEHLIICLETGYEATLDEIAEVCGLRHSSMPAVYSEISRLRRAGMNIKCRYNEKKQRFVYWVPKGNGRG